MDSLVAFVAPLGLGTRPIFSGGEVAYYHLPGQPAQELAAPGPYNRASFRLR